LSGQGTLFEQIFATKFPDWFKVSLEIIEKKKYMKDLIVLSAFNTEGIEALGRPWGMLTSQAALAVKASIAALEHAKAKQEQSAVAHN
jgi:hypothetical protein